MIETPKVARNAFWMCLSVAVSVLQGVAVTYVMARYLGLVTFGRLGLIMSCTNVILFASGSVVSNVLRESARGQFEGAGLVVAAMFTQVLLAAPVLLAVLGILWGVSREPALLGPAAMLGIALMVRTVLGPVVGLQLGRERMEWQLLDSAQLLLSFAAMLGFVLLDTGLYALPLASLVGTGVVGMAAVALLRHRITARRLRPSRAVLRSVAVSSLLWAGVNVAQQVQWSVEPLLAPAVMNAGDVGLFIAGGRLLPGIRSLAAALALVFLPAFVRDVAAGDSRGLSDHAEGLIRWVVPGGLAFTAALVSCSALIVKLLYPPEFAAAAPILSRLSLDVTALLLHWQAMCLLFAAEKLRALMTGYGIALAVRVALGVWLGSAHGAPGLATAQVLSDWTLALMLQAIALRALRLGYGTTLLRTTTGAFGALAVLVMAAQRSLPVALGGAAAAYALVSSRAR